jgi:hypothetical protein
MPAHPPRCAGSSRPSGSIGRADATHRRHRRRRGDHPHGDHIAGLADLLTAYDGRGAEFWDPGYFHPTCTHFKIMELLERQTGVVYVQPTSGMRRFIGNTEVTVLTPSVGLRNRYDTYGVDINNAAISLRVATPAGRATFVPGESWQPLDCILTPPRIPCRIARRDRETYGRNQV